jgi:glutamate synthase (ferredoxin)
MKNLNSKKIKENFKLIKDYGSYDPNLEHDSCGVGLIANIKGMPSNEIIKKSLVALDNLEHRGASGADKNTGDGAGILIQIPYDFFEEETKKMGISITKGEFGTGLFFLSKDDDIAKKSQEIL